MDWISVKRLPSMDGKEWYDIRFEGMDRATTVVRQPLEEMESLIERTRRKWSAREKERNNER